LPTYISSTITLQGVPKVAETEIPHNIFCPLQKISVFGNFLFEKKQVENKIISKQVFVGLSLVFYQTEDRTSIVIVFFKTLVCFVISTSIPYFTVSSIAIPV
jgi:hypothetical protein